MPAYAVLLQARYQFIRQQDTTSVLVAIGFLAALAAILTAAGIISGGRHSRAARRAARFSRRAFRRAAAAHGLGPAHTALLEEIVSSARLAQPMLLFSSMGLLDETLRRAVNAARARTDLTEEKRDQRIGQLLEIRRLIERNQRRPNAVLMRSTAALRPGQELTLTLPDGSRLATRITFNLRRMLACEMPPGFSRDRWRKGTPVRAELWRQGDAGYAFQSKILAYDSMGGRPVFLLQHSKTLRRSQRRADRRRPLGRNCFFYPIMLMESGRGRRAKRVAVVQESFRHIGILENVSAGGCAISTQTPLPRGRLLRVDFEVGSRHKVVAYGKVQRATAVDSRRGIMHVMFTRVSSRHLNEILSYVYAYDDSAAQQRRATRPPLRFGRSLTAPPEAG